MPRFSYRRRPGNTDVEGLYAVNECTPVCVLNALVSTSPQGVLCQNILSYRDLGAFGDVAISQSMAERVRSVQLLGGTTRVFEYISLQ